ncbi:MAG: hypothetical protein RBR99_05465 [Dehalococcoidales bacterium]|jgi:hypothetical protein|nr:hypothetical protein [Dehalococcoidales bacterium]MDX9986883.1 hypothetical protein [Dehalococcoidales bacterium]
MVQQITDKCWQVEARSEETRQFIRDIKRQTRRKFTAEEKVRIVLEGFRRDTPYRPSGLRMAMPREPGLNLIPSRQRWLRWYLMVY